MFFFYYPFTRLILLLLNISLKLSTSSLDELISARIQGYVIFGLFLLPLILNTYVNIRFWHLLVFYYLLLVFVIPMINWLLNIYNSFMQKSTKMAVSFEQTLVNAVYERKNQLTLNFSN